ncbi:MAG TPA: L,D-transpeptidase, partial [Gaiellaceae bacterium]|nr:L,D-transpeptidase [Gaiellaceae bacterium]
ILLSVRSSGGSQSTQHRVRSAHRATPRSAVEPKHVKRNAVRGVKSQRRREPALRPTNDLASLPLAGRRWIPWRDDGTSVVAGARHVWVRVYARPRGRRPTLLLHNPDRIGSPRMLLVHTQRKHWVRVYLPNRPDERTGWVHRRAVRLLTNPYRIVVRLHAHRLLLWKGDRVVLRARTVVGKPSTPTPAGMYFIVDLLRPPNPDGAYGPYAFNLSAHSRVLRTFAGGDGVVAIHGTDEPWLIGQSVSHGCIRVRNEVIRRLARVLPLGTPVEIRR